jgi:hypothetical protein
MDCFVFKFVIKIVNVTIGFVMIRSRNIDLINTGEKKVKKLKGIIIGLVIVGVIYFATKEEYDPSIHNEYLQEFISQSRFKGLMMPDKENPFGTGYDIEVTKSEDKKELPHEVSSEKYYRYTIHISINNKFVEYPKSNRWKVFEDITNQFEDITVGEDTKFAGYYDYVILTFRDNEEIYQVFDGDDDTYQYDHDHFSYRMNVFGFPKELDGKEYEDYMLDYYDDDGKPVYSN